MELLLQKIFIKKKTIYSLFRIGFLTYKNIILVVSSLFFYAWGEPSYVIMLMLSILINYIFGRVIDAAYGTVTSRIMTVIAVMLNLGLLAVFKYTGFFVENINAVCRSVFLFTRSRHYRTFLTYTTEKQRFRNHL